MFDCSPWACLPAWTLAVTVHPVSPKPARPYLKHCYVVEKSKHAARWQCGTRVRRLSVSASSLHRLATDADSRYTGRMQYVCYRWLTSIACRLQA